VQPGAARNPRRSTAGGAESALPAPGARKLVDGQERRALDAGDDQLREALAARIVTGAAPWLMTTRRTVPR